MTTRTLLRRPWRLAVAGTVAIVVLPAACGGDGGDSARRVRGSSTTGTTQTSAPTKAPTSTTAIANATTPCRGTAPPARYDHVVVVMMENRTWGKVGGPAFHDMPYLASLANKCAYYNDWTNTNSQQSSLTQYIGLTSGVDNSNTVDGCSPSTRCSSTDDNVFRQVRRGGGHPRSYVEGATSHCSADGNAARHVPALYYRGTYQDNGGTHHDSDFCTEEVVPLGELDPNHLPTFAFVTPTLCNDGHDCGNDSVDGWARSHIGALLGGDDYRAGTTAVLVLWDESDPLPNLIIAPGALPGPRPGAGSHASALKTIEELLGLPVLPQGQLPGADDLRSTAPV